MKRRVMAMILLCVMAFSLVSCGGSSGGADAFVGTWTIESVETEGMTVGKEMLSAMGADTWSITIKEDGTADMTILGTTQSIKGTFNGNKFTVSDGEMPMDMVIEGGKLVIDAGEEGKLIFTK